VRDASTIVPFLEQFSFIETIERFIEGSDDAWSLRELARYTGCR
jgi:hypothetical protein